jgi:hypothetical protein
MAEKARQEEIAAKYQRSLRRQARREQEEAEIAHDPKGPFAKMILDERYYNAQKDAEQHQARQQAQLYEERYGDRARLMAQQQFRTNNFLNQMAASNTWVDQKPMRDMQQMRNTNFLERMAAMQIAPPESRARSPPKSGGRRTRKSKRTKRTKRSKRSKRTRQN